MFKRGDSNFTSTQPKSASISHKLSSVKGKKGTARNRFSFGEQSSTVGVLAYLEPFLKHCLHGFNDGQSRPSFEQI